MKIMISFLSAIIIFLGVLPFFKIPFLPSTGIGYAILLTVVGILVAVAGIANNLLVGLEKFVVVVQGSIVAILGVIHFFPTLFAFLPRDGIWHTLFIIAVGTAGLLYGLFGMA